MSEPIPPGWYRAANPDCLRWWDGTGWTEHTHPLPDGPPPLHYAGPPRPETTVPAPTGRQPGEMRDGRIRVNGPHNMVCPHCKSQGTVKRIGRIKNQTYHCTSCFARWTID